MVASHKAFVADRTGEAFLSRVGSQMSLQLVRSGEAFAAEQPVTNERPLASVPPQVCLEVRSLAVDLTAARDVTAVEALPPKAGSGRSKALGLLAVGAVAGCSARVSSGRPGRASQS